jgi:hypothetical protein
MTLYVCQEYKGFLSPERLPDVESSQKLEVKSNGILLSGLAQISFIRRTSFSFLFNRLKIVHLVDQQFFSSVHYKN